MKLWVVYESTSRSVLAYLTKFWPSIFCLLSTFIANNIPVDSSLTKYTSPKLPLPNSFRGMKSSGPTLSATNVTVGLSFYWSYSKDEFYRIDGYLWILSWIWICFYLVGYFVISLLTLVLLLGYYYYYCYCGFFMFLTTLDSFALEPPPDEVAEFWVCCDY